MTTVAEWIDTTKDMLLSGAREELDILAVAIPDGAATTLTVTDAANGIQAGAEIEVDLERMYVRSVAGTTVTVRRGYRGSTPVAHAIGADVIVLPKFPKARILREINNELSSLSSPTNGLYRTIPLNLTWQGTTVGYDLAGVTDIEDVLSVQWQGYTGKEWHPVPPMHYRLARSQQTTDFPSGLALFFNSPVSGRAVRVVYKSPFSPLSTLTEVVETVTGIPATAVDIPPMGAAINLAAPGEVRRTFTDAQGDPRADEDVPPGARTNSVRWLMAQRQRRINEESTRLARDFPVTLAR